MLPPRAAIQFEESVAKVVTIYAEETPWQKQRLKLIPAFVQRARDVFGNDIPMTDFYFFENHDDLKSGYLHLTKDSSPAHCTGYAENGSGVVIIGTRTNKHDDVGAGVIMHEYGHALCHATYGRRYLLDIPAWLNEGFADFIARPWFEDIYKNAERIIRDEAEYGNVPPFNVFATEFYRFDRASYPIARLMVLQLLRDCEPKVIAQILQDAKKRRGAFNKIVREISGFTAEQLFAQTLNTR